MSGDCAAWRQYALHAGPALADRIPVPPNRRTAVLFAEHNMRILFPFAKGMIRRKVASRLDLLREVIEGTG